GGRLPWQASPPACSTMLSTAQPVSLIQLSLSKRQRSRALAFPSSCVSAISTLRHALSPSQRNTSVQLPPPLLLASTMPKSQPPSVRQRESKRSTTSV